MFAYGADGIVDYSLGLTRAGLARLLALGPPPPGGVPMAMVAAAEVTVEWVAAVPRHPDTGKSRRFLSRPA